LSKFHILFERIIPHDSFKLLIYNNEQVYSCGWEIIGMADIGVRARGLREAAHGQDYGKAIIFRAKAKFFGQKPTAKNEKKNFFWIFK